MVAGATAMNVPVRSWMEQSLCVLNNATAQLATPFGFFEVLKELHDHVAIKFIDLKVLLAALELPAAGITSPTTAAAPEMLMEQIHQRLTSLRIHGHNHC